MTCDDCIDHLDGVCGYIYCKKPFPEEVLRRVYWVRGGRGDWGTGYGDGGEEKDWGFTAQDAE